MPLEVKWTKRAENSFDDIVQYIKLKFGDSTAKKFATQSFEILELLCLYPKMGTIEDSKKEFLVLCYQNKQLCFTELQRVKLSY